MAQVAAKQHALVTTSHRCSQCRDTGVVMASCARDCASHPIPCSCQDGQEASRHEWSALRIELLLGVPLAGVAGALLVLFH